MNPTLRFTARFLAGLLVLLLVIVSLVALFFNANDYRSQIQKWTLTNLGYELEVAHIEWHITQPTQITLEQVSLQLPATDTLASQPIAQIERMDLQLSTTGWFSRSLTIKQLTVQRPQLFVTDALLQHLDSRAVEPESQPERVANNPLLISALNIQQISIKNLDADLSLAKSAPGAIRDLNLELQNWRLIEDNQLLTTHGSFALQIAAKQAIVNNFILEDLVINATLQQQILNIEQFDARYLNGKLAAQLDLNIVAPFSLIVKQLSLADLNLEYSDQWVQNFQPNPLPAPPTNTSSASATTTKTMATYQQQTSPALFNRIEIKDLVLNQVSFTSYDKSLPLTFNKLDLQLKNVPILIDGKWLDLSKTQLDSEFNAAVRELYYAGTSITDLVIKSRVQGNKWEFYQVLGNSFDGNFSALFDISLQRYPDLHISHFNAKDLDIGIQPQWLGQVGEGTEKDTIDEQIEAQVEELADSADNTLLAINSLVIDKLDLENINLLSYADDLPLSIRGLSLSLDQAQLVKQRQLLSIPPQWSQDAQFELSIKEALYQGMRADQIKIKGKLNAEFLNPDSLQQLLPNIPATTSGSTMVTAPEKKVIRLD